MPRLPTSEALGERPTARPDRGVVSYRPAGGGEAPGLALVQAGKELQSISDTIERIDGELTKARRTSQLADAVGRATGELGELELAFQNDQDFKTSPNRFRQKADEIGARYQQSIDDEMVREAFKREYRKLSQTKHLNVVKSAFGQEKDYNVASLDSNLDIYATQAANAANVAEEEVILNQARLSIASMRRGGWITDVDAGKRERNLLGKIDQAKALRDMRMNVSQAADKLALDPNYLPNLDPTQRASLTDQAYRRADSEKRRADAEAEKARKTRGDEIMKQAWEMEAKGALTREFVRDARAFVEPGEYHSLIRALKEGATKNDDAALAELNRILYVENDPGKAERQAFQYQKSGLLKSQTLGAFLSTARSHARQEGPRTPYERERSYIVNAIKPSEMVPDPAASARFAIAMREFDDYASQNPNATGKELREKADDILKRRSLVDMIDLARRTGASGRSDPKGALDDITAKARQLKSDFDSKKITKPEFDKKMTELNRARIAAEESLGRQ